MEDQRYRSFSIIANLSELEAFILHDPSAQSLYQQYLAFVSPSGRKANHIPFFSDIVDFCERFSWPKSLSLDYYRAELFIVFEKYFLENSELLLDIPPERISQVQRNIERNVTLAAFKPAIKAVVRDLAFIYLDGFMSSGIFKDYKDNVLVDFNLSDVPKLALKDKDSSHKLKKFFGDKFVEAGASSAKTSLRDQPKHIKEYKLSKIFGERVGVEKTTLLSGTEEQEESRRLRQTTARRDRRLHVFFGDNFEIEDTLFSERVRSRSRSIGDIQECRKQPTHVKSFRLAKFFGSRPPSDGVPAQSVPSASATDNTSTSKAININLAKARETAIAGHSKKQHLNRFFGERMDPMKEANSISFATQPGNVKACTLKKIFGESASHTVSFDAGTWPKSRNMKSRAKLEKIFGPFEA